jgi:hypothetical protein
MPTYAEVQKVLGPHYGRDLDGWLCHADGSLSLVFSSGAIQLSVSDRGALTLTGLSPEQVMSRHKNEVSNNQAAEIAISQVGKALDEREYYGGGPHASQ